MTDTRPESTATDAPQDPVTRTRRPHPGRPASAFLLVLWGWYSLNGFRGPTTPIRISDDNSGAAVRQLLFAGSAALTLWLLFTSANLWRTARTHTKLIMFGAWLPVTAAYSAIPGTTVKRSILFLCGATTACGVATFRKHPVRDTAQLIMQTCTGVAWMSLAWMIALPADITTNPGRPGLAGVTQHPNTIAPAMVVGLVLAIGFTPTNRSQKLWKIAGIAGNAIVLVLASSMTSLGLGAVAIITYAFLWFGPSARTLALIVGMMTTVAVLLLGPGALVDSALGSVGRDASMSGRDQLWIAIIAEIQHAPFFGRGWGAFWIEGRGREIVGTWNPRQSHNAYLDIVLDVGLIGFALFLVFLLPALVAVRRSWLNNSDDQRIDAAMISLAIGLFSVYGLQQSFIGKVDSFPFISLLLLATAVIEREARARPIPATDALPHLVTHPAPI